jgi:membrane associated rhomboid family serine protease
MREVQAYYDAGRISRELYDQVVSIPTLGASGAVMGIFAAFAYTFPNTELLIIPIPIPIKAKWAMIGMIALDLFGGFSNQNSGVAHFAHVGGAAIGLLIIIGVISLACLAYSLWEWRGNDRKRRNARLRARNLA